MSAPQRSLFRCREWTVSSNSKIGKITEIVPLEQAESAKTFLMPLSHWTAAVQGPTPVYNTHITFCPRLHCLFSVAQVVEIVSRFAGLQCSFSQIVQCWAVQLDVWPQRSSTLPPPCTSGWCWQVREGGVDIHGRGWGDKGEGHPKVLLSLRS